MSTRQIRSVLAAAAATLALAIGVGAPASASDGYIYYSGTLNCPSFMQAKIQFTAKTTSGNAFGFIDWNRVGATKFVRTEFVITTKSHTYSFTSPFGGPSHYIMPIEWNSTLSIYQTCR